MSPTIGVVLTTPFVTDNSADSGVSVTLEVLLVGSGSKSRADATVATLVWATPDTTSTVIVSVVEPEAASDPTSQMPVPTVYGPWLGWADTNCRPAGGTPEFYPVEGFPIAFVPDVEYDQQTLQLAPGDRIYLYSDGVPEAMDKDRQQLGDEALAGVLASTRARPLEESVGELLQRVEEWCRPIGPLDDVSILGVEWRP